MIKEFVEKIPQNSKIAIFGAGLSGTNLKEYIEVNRRDIKVLYYVDSFKEGNQDGLEIVKLIDLPKHTQEIDLLIVATRNRLFEQTIIFDYLGLNYLIVPNKLEKFFRLNQYEENIQKVSNILSTQEDKDLFKMIWDLVTGNEPYEIQNYVKEKHGIKLTGPTRNYQAQYQEFINKNEIKTVLDAGVCNGIQFFVYKKNFKNLQKIYGFEPMYDKFQNDIYDTFLKNIPEIEIIEFGLWNEATELSFVETQVQAGSHVQNAKMNKKLTENDKITTIKTTTIDKFKKEKNVEKVDFIKMDIEGAELSALKGAKETILSDRPQLAVSLYHNPTDYFEIPLYLYEILKDKDYNFHIGHYSPLHLETVLYAIPKELEQNKNC